MSSRSAWVAIRTWASSRVSATIRRVAAFERNVESGRTARRIACGARVPGASKPNAAPVACAWHGIVSVKRSSRPIASRSRWRGREIGLGRRVRDNKAAAVRRVGLPRVGWAVGPRLPRRSARRRDAASCGASSRPSAARTAATTRGHRCPRRRLDERRQGVAAWSAEDGDLTGGRSEPAIAVASARGPGWRRPCRRGSRRAAGAAATCPGDLAGWRIAGRVWRGGDPPSGRERHADSRHRTWWPAGR